MTEEQNIEEQLEHFERVAALSVALKKNIEYLSYCTHLSQIEHEALAQITTKIADVCCRKEGTGFESWRDIAGYATLVATHIKQEESNALELERKMHEAISGKEAQK